MELQEHLQGVHFSSILLSIYFILIPFDNTLNLWGSGTLTKYFGIAIIFAIFFRVLFVNNFIVLKKNIFISIYIFLLLAVLSLFFSINQTKSIEWFQYLLNLIMLFQVSVLIELTDNEQILIEYFCITGGLLVFFELFFGTASMNYLNSGRLSLSITGGSVNPNELSRAMLLPICCSIDRLLKAERKSERFLMISLLILLLISTVATGSRGGAMAAIIPCLFMIFLNKEVDNRKKIGLLFFIIVLFYIVYITFLKDVIDAGVLARLSPEGFLLSNGTGRYEIWGNALRGGNTFSAKDILIGFGGGTFPYWFEKYYGSQIASHNTFLGLLFETGLLGLACIVFMYIRIIRRSMKNNNIFALSLIFGLIIGATSMDIMSKKYYWGALVLALMIKA